VSVLQAAPGVKRKARDGSRGWRGGGLTDEAPWWRVALMPLCSAVNGSLCHERVGPQPTRTQLGAKQRWTMELPARIIVRDSNYAWEGFFRYGTVRALAPLASPRVPVVLAVDIATWTTADPRGPASAYPSDGP
jgi:hypothetical protein